MTELHCAGQRNSNVELVNGPQSSPLRPHSALAPQYADVQSIKESGGVRKDCAREKKESPIMYPTTRRAKSHGEVRRRVARIKAGSRDNVRER